MTASGNAGPCKASSCSGTCTCSIRRDEPAVSLCELMQDGRGVVLDASTDGQASRLVAAAARRIRCVAVAAGPSMPIRPDACVAWAGEENDTGRLEEALRRWFGS